MADRVIDHPILNRPYAKLPYYLLADSAGGRA